MREKDGFYTVEDIRNRLSISTLVFWRFRPISEKSLAELARNGFTRIELLESPEQFDMADARSMRYIAEACRSCGLQIAAYHAHMVKFCDLDTEKKRKARVEVCRRQIDTMLDLGARLWASHARRIDDITIRSYEEMARHIEGTQAVIAVENFMDNGLWVEDRVAFLDRLNHPQVGMILDIGHVRDGNGDNPMTLPGGPSRVIDLCGHHLRHLHLHGFKDGMDHHPPLVTGDTIQWIELFRKLRSIEYAGDFNFEPRGEAHHADAVATTARAPERIVRMEAQMR